MNSTDKADAKKLAKFWRDRLSPAAERLKSRGKELLDVEISGSSWKVPASDIPELSDLSSSTLGEQLRARFVADGLEELADLMPDLMKLADEIRPTGETGEEIDPFVYVMH